MTNIVTIAEDLTTAKIHCVYNAEPVYVLIDIDDLKTVADIGNRRWSVTHNNGRNLYCSVHIDGKKVFMHRLIAAFPDGLEIDHQNGNGLDNRRANLRPCTRQENAAKMRIGVEPTRRNKLGCRGVSRTRYGRYTVRAGNRWLGSFGTLDQARRAYADYRTAVNTQRTGRV